MLRLITEELYGTAPSQIITILNRTKMNLKQIQNASGLLLPDIKNAIILLIQQNILHKEDTPKPTYSLKPEEILSRVRFPRYIRLINQKFGDIGIAEELMENGCMTLAQISEAVQSYKRKTDDKTVMSLLNNMIENEYLVVVDGKIEFQENLTKKVKKTAGKPRKKAKIDPETVIEPQISSAIPNFSEANVYFRLNFHKLNREIISELIGNLANFKVNLPAAVIAETMYKLGPNKQVTPTDIFENLPAAPKINKNTIESYLNLLQSEAELVTQTSTSTYQLNILMIRSILQNSTIEKIIKGRFSDYHSRIFRILIAKGLLDEKTISELTLLPLRETRASINDLFTAGFIHIQNLPSMLVYGIKAEQIKEDLINQLYISMQNLKLRLHNEMEEAWNLVQRVGSLSNEEKIQLDRYKQTEARIESAILDIDRSLLIFKEI